MVGIQDFPYDMKNRDAECTAFSKSISRPLAEEMEKHNSDLYVNI